MPARMHRRAALACLAALAAPLALTPAIAAPATIGLVVMHGKGGNPRKMIELVSALERQGMQVANLDMPWSGRREYDVDLQAGVDEVTKALQDLRAKGATRLFVAGHSQGALFAMLYAGRHPVDGVVAIAPGGAVDTAGFTRNLAEHVAKARKMKEEGAPTRPASPTSRAAARLRTCAPAPTPT